MRSLCASSRNSILRLFRASIRKERAESVYHLRSAGRYRNAQRYIPSIAEKLGSSSAPSDLVRWRLIKRDLSNNPWRWSKITSNFLNPLNSLLTDGEEIVVLACKPCEQKVNIDNEQRWATCDKFRVLGTLCKEKSHCRFLDYYSCIFFLQNIW